MADLAGVSTRTLRYYDEIGLLSPKRTTGSEYRIYSEAEVDQLQQILFYREMDLELAAIQKILDAESFEQMAALRSHLSELQKKQKRLTLLIQNVTKTIQKEEGVIQMSDQEKFQGFKESLIQKNEEAYGEEIRSKYGKEAVEESNAKMMKLTEEEYKQWEKLGARLNECLKQAVQSGADPAGNEGREIAELHKEWLQISTPKYTVQMHRGLAEMYVADERFKAYYDGEVTGCAQFLRDAVTEHII